MESRRASVTVLAVTGVVGGVLLLALLVTWAASIGPSGVLRGDGIAPVRISLSESATPESIAPSEQTNVERLMERQPDGAPWYLRALAYLLEAAGVVVILLLLHRVARWLRQLYDARPRRGPPVETIDFDVLTDSAGVADELLRDAGEQRAALQTGTPRNGIVECWGRFEDQAARSGLAREAAETSSEFTLRILGLVEADTVAVSRLAALYREARFSEHEMPESLRAEAVEALAVIHDTVLSTYARSRS